MTKKELTKWANRLHEPECLVLIDELIPCDNYSFLNRFAKDQPDVFYIDDRVKIKNKRKIYAVVNRLWQIRKLISHAEKSIKET